MPPTPWTVVAAEGLSKRDVFRLPDPFAVITVDAEQTHTTSVIKKTLDPYWNEGFDMLVPHCRTSMFFEALILAEFHSVM